MRKIDKSLATKAFEPEIKAYALEYLRMKGHITKKDIVINEFTIDSYSRRADLVIIRDDYLLAIEIKSEFDSLARLSGQTEKYLEFFDKVLLVTSDSHLEKSIEKVNSRVEILTYSNTVLKIVRRGKKKEIKNKENLLKMMTIKELSFFAKKNGYQDKKLSRALLMAFLSKLSVKAIRAFLIDSLRKRYHKNSDYFWSKIDGEGITKESINNLNVQKKIRNKKNLSTHEWLSNLNDVISSKCTDN